MPPAILDELTALPISRQRRYQLRKRREGKCIRCGHRSVNDGYFCETHRQLNNIAIRESQRRRFGLKNRYYDAESYRFFGSCPRGRQLLDAARGYLHNGRLATAQNASANFHASLMSGFCALEAFVDAITDDLATHSLLTAHDRHILRPRNIQWLNGSCRLPEALPPEERVEYLLRNFSNAAIDADNRDDGDWRAFQRAVVLRNAQLRPAPAPLRGHDAADALAAILNLVDTLSVEIYGRR